MSILSKKTFEDLSKIHAPDSASFFVPTDRSGPNEKSRITFKNQLQAVKNQLESTGRDKRFISNYLKPLEEILDNTNFWRQLSDGLAVFHNADYHKTLILPVHFSDSYFIGSRFYLMPLIPYFNDNGSFYILALSLKKSRLFEASRDEIQELKTGDDIPRMLEDTVGYDYKEKSLQFRTQGAKSGDTMFHGHGAGKDEKGIETLQFLKDLNKGFINMIGKDGYPLVVAAVDDVFSKFKQINNYKNLHEKNISGNPDNTDTMLLHEKAWDLMKDHFSSQRTEAIEAYKRNKTTGKTSSDIRQVISQSIAGNTQILFTERGKHIWGGYNDKTQEMQLHREAQNGDECLIDKAAVSTLLQGGEVYVQDSENMPDNQSPVNALFRYQATNA